MSSQRNSAQNLDQTCSGRPGKSGWNDAGEFLAVHFCQLCISIQHRTYHSNMVHMIHTLHIDVERLIMEYLNMYYASFWWQNPKHMDWSGIVECHYDCTTWTCRLAYQLPTIATTALSTGISEWKWYLKLNITSMEPHLCVSVFVIGTLNSGRFRGSQLDRKNSGRLQRSAKNTSCQFIWSLSQTM